MTKYPNWHRQFRCAALALCIAGICAEADTFTRHKKWSPVGPNPCAIVAVDLNGDSLPDIVTADRGVLTSPQEERPANDELSLLIAGEELNFERQPPLRTGFGPYCIVAANIDERKALDLVVGCFHATRGRNLCLFCNLGDNLFKPTHFLASSNLLAEWVTGYIQQGLFEPELFAAPDDLLPYERTRDSEGVPLFTKPGITSVAVGHFDHDGYRDVVATGWSSDVLIVFPGDQTTYFREPRMLKAPGGPRDIEAADFDGDGELDLAMTLYASGQIAIWKGLGNTHFEPVTQFYSTGDLPHKIEAGDVDGDGNTDLVVSHCYADDSIAIFYGGEGFSFDLRQEIVLGKDRRVIEHEIRDILLKDLNGDKRLDIAAACYASGEVTVLINKSGVPHGMQEFSSETYAYEDARPRALAAADFNQDGATDLAVALWEADAVALLLGKAKKE